MEKKFREVLKHSGLNVAAMVRITYRRASRLLWLLGIKPEGLALFLAG